MRRNITYENIRDGCGKNDKGQAGAGMPASGTLAGSRIVMGKPRVMRSGRIRLSDRCNRCTDRTAVGARTGAPTGILEMAQLVIPGASRDSALKRGPNLNSQVKMGGERLREASRTFFRKLSSDAQLTSTARIFAGLSPWALTRCMLVES